ncbi:MAG: Ig-like domain-containing protein, partial [Propionibacteriaceae bacterium]|nr:Ig-like domain-containing protein [Propionibacteriaceae bacterium]
MKRSNPARWLAGGVALLTMVATFLATSTPSQAATGDESHSSAQFISGTVLPIDLSAVAFLNGVRSDYVEQSPAQPADEKTGSIDVGALSLIGANLGTVSVPLGDLLQVGAVNQYSYAGPNGVSRAASGAVSDAGVVDTSVLTQFPANASLDLMKIIPSTPLLSSASFHMGAVTGVAALDGAKLADGTTLATSCADLSQPDHCRGYNIGDAGMTLTSPIFGTAAQTVNSALGPISSAINTVSSTIINTITSTLQTGLNVLGGNVNIQAGVSVNLQQAVDKVLNQTVSAGGVSINLAQGTIELDLNQLMGLNNMPPNTDVFSAEFAKVVAAQINNVMQGIQDQLNSVVANALDSVRLTINGSGCPVPTLPFLGCVPGTVSVNYDGSLQEFINGSKSISFGGSGFASLGAAIINPLISTVQAGLSTVVQPIISGAIATAGAAVGTLFSTIGTALSPALNLFGQAMQVRVNVQEENVDGQGTFTEVATRFTLLGGSGLTLNLGKAVVGPNKSNKVAAAPVITGPAQGSSTEDSTPAITGTGEPGATVTVSVDGAPVGTAVVQPDGTWTLTPTTPLAVGPHQVTATQNNGAGDSPAATSDFTVTEPTGPADTTPPAAPVITGPVDGSTTTDNTPTITGTGEPGATVTVTVDGTPIGDAVVQPDGTWTLTPTTPLADGPHTIGATQKDPAGNQSPPAQVGVTVDTTAPSAPEILTPAQGSSTTNTTPAVTGKGEPGATVTVQIDGVDVGTATVGTDGTWTVTPTTPLALGPHQVTATQRDAAGNLSTPDSKDFTVVAPTIPPDTTAPDAPVITGPTDGSTTNDSTPTITGTGEPGDTVTVRDRRDTDPGPGPVIGTTVVQPDGTWSVTPTTPLQQGPQNITADQTDPAGNTSGSDDAEFTLDSEPPAAPVITSPAPGSTTNDSTPTITGTGVPGDTVEVSVDGTPIGKVTVQPDGTWTLTPTTPLTDGPHTITATQTDPAGNTSGPATAPITVDSTPPAAPVITSPADGSTTNDTTPTITGTGEPGDTVTVRDRRDTETGPGEVIGTTKVQPDGTWTLTPTTPLPQGPQNITADQTDPAGNTSPPDDTNVTVDSAAPAAPVITGPANGSTTGDSTPTITGTGEPGATVTVSVDGVPVGQTTVQPDGTWSLTPTTPLADGPHTITARQTDPAGNPSPEASSQVKVDTATPSAPVILTPANGSTTTDTTPTITGTGEPGSTVTVSVDGTPIGTATVQPDGTWSVTPTTALPLGTHTVTATQTDGAGHTSPQASNDFTVTSPTNPPDTTAPAAPVITGPANGSTTGDSTPTITGTGEPGATVTVDVDGKPVGSTVVNPDGTWSYTPTAPLPDGPHTITARQTDPAGNTSPPAQVGVTVDTTAPAAPVILTPADKSTTTDSTPTITGTGEPGATVAVAIDGHPVGTTVVRNDGTWSYTPTNPLSNATHTVSATQTDPSGNTSPASSHEFTVDTSGGSDTTAPAAPVIVTPADGSSTSDPTPTITGTGEPGATVTVSVDGKPIGSTV